MRALVAGGAGFIGAQLCARLLDRGDEVVCVDNLVTGSADNVEGLGRAGRDSRSSRLTSARSVPVDGPLDAVINLACPASPADFGPLALEILEVGSRGVANLLDLARRHGARFLQASTSEVYGEPLVHPQPETYWGNVNPVGPRSVYDEAKRFGEALTMAYHRRHGLEVRIARIFNTYGPGMRADDGRVVSNFVTQALRGEPLTVYGDGSQTRSFCYVDDLAAGLAGPARLGLHRPGQHRQRRRAHRAGGGPTGARAVGLHVGHRLRPSTRSTTRAVRRPDLTVARRELGWEPTTPLFGTGWPAPSSGSRPARSVTAAA